MKETRRTRTNQRMLDYARANQQDTRPRPKNCDICDQPFGDQKGNAHGDGQTTIWECDACRDAINRGMGIVK